jgi:hypothetical protein
MKVLAVGCLLAVTLTSPAAAGEAEALQISARIASLHLPFGTILDPFLDSDGQVTAYTRCGDSALWTGHYLAAESFRYAATHSPESLEAVKRALNGLRLLVDVTGSGRLARCAVPVDSGYAEGILQEEAQNGVFRGTLDGIDYYWIGNTSRDQFSGVFFGLAVANEFAPDVDVRSLASRLATSLLDRLQADDWAVTDPDGAPSTVFWARPDQELSLLAVGRLLNPGRFSSDYGSLRLWDAPSMGVPIGVDTLDPYDSYYKFNLDYINLFTLVRSEGNALYRGWYRGAYDTLRKATEGHGNAHFNMIDRAIRGPDAARDAETVRLLDEWLKRPRLDVTVDLRGKYPACGDDRACQPIPVNQRVTTDFLWQRSPFQLYGPGYGAVEGAGIDYILPYWMARYYGIEQEDANVPPPDTPGEPEPGSVVAVSGRARAGVPADGGRSESQPQSIGTGQR